MSQAQEYERHKPHRFGRFLHKIFNRITLTALFLLFQFAWLFWLTMQLAQHAVWIELGLSLLSLLLALVIVRREDNPAYKLGWLFVLCALPVFGVPLYLLLSNKHLSRRLRKKLEQTGRDHPVPSRPIGEDIEPRLGATCRYLSRFGGGCPDRETDATYFPMGDEMYRSLLRDLEAAEHYIFLEYFIICEGKMLDGIMEVLYRKAAAGLDVRIIYDDVGCEAAASPTFVPDAQRHGIRTLAFNPLIPVISIVMNHRDHRKIVVIDGKVAYTGGINVADEYINERKRFGVWKDTALRLSGGAAVSFLYMFLNLWNALRPTETDYTPFLPPASETPSLSAEPDRPALVLPFSDSPLDEENVGQTVYLEILARAERYVYIFTPYLILDNEMQSALCTAAKRGVDVRIVTPGIPDKKAVFRLTRSYYPPLLKAGVSIYEYTPGFLHAKSFVSDDAVGVVGSINLDFRSLYLHFECGTLLLGGRAVQDLRDDALATMAESRRVTSADCRPPRALTGRLVDAVLRALSPLF